MKKQVLAVVLLMLVMLAVALPAMAEEARFMSYPTISGDRVVFTYEQDLWSVAASGGRAVRLTNHPGQEYAAKFSPDGRWLAFTAEYDGPPSVYLMPAEGGEPVRLTWTPGAAFVEHFKARKLGTVVGVPSWGGLVGIINGQTTIDNGTVQQSNNAFYGREGAWWVENHGADPDILVDNDPASVMAGRDPQLEKAIEVVLEKIKQNPLKFPPKPPYPKRVP
jgi:dipeptidyl aminopeptidase/acylaminoacyl peptidase